MANKEAPKKPVKEESKPKKYGETRKRTDSKEPRYSGR